MIAEPFIFTVGQRAGEITWFEVNEKSPYQNGHLFPDKSAMMPYADFEREKCKAIEGKCEEVCECILETHGQGYVFSWYFGDRGASHLWSDDVIGYADYLDDTESNRLLKRAEFLKAVCEKEGVTWLPATGGIIEPPKEYEKPTLASLEGCCVGIDWGEEGGDNTCFQFCVEGNPFKNKEEEERKRLAKEIGELAEKTMREAWKETDVVEELCEEKEECLHIYRTVEMWAESDCVRCGKTRTGKDVNVLSEDYKRETFYTKEEIDDQNEKILELAEEIAVHIGNAGDSKHLRKKCEKLRSKLF